MVPAVGTASGLLASLCARRCWIAIELGGCAELWCMHQPAGPRQFQHVRSSPPTHRPSTRCARPTPRPPASPAMRRPAAALAWRCRRKRMRKLIYIPGCRPLEAGCAGENPRALRRRPRRASSSCSCARSRARSPPCFCGVMRLGGGCGAARRRDARKGSRSVRACDWSGGCSCGATSTAPVA
jgi:hypothetical protein